VFSVPDATGVPASCSFRIVRTTDFKLSAEAGHQTAIATALTALIRQTTTVRTSPSKGCSDYLTAGTTVAQLPFSTRHLAGAVYVRPPEGDRT
jgi:hypothetical protein